MLSLLGAAKSRACCYWRFFAALRMTMRRAQNGNVELLLRAISWGFCRGFGGRFCWRLLGFLRRFSVLRFLGVLRRLLGQCILCWRRRRRMKRGQTLSLAMRGNILREFVLTVEMFDHVPEREVLIQTLV